MEVRQQVPWQIKLTSFLGINLLRRHCQLPVDHSDEQMGALLRISIPKDMAASTLTFFRERGHLF